MEVSDGFFCQQNGIKAQMGPRKVGLNCDSYEEGPEDSQMSAEAPSEKPSSCEANILYRLSGFRSSPTVIRIRPIA